LKSEIRFYEGLKGSGVVASITYARSRVIFDFGAPFNPMTQPYDGQVEPRISARVRDAIRLGQIPAVDRVFSEKDLGLGNPILPYEKSKLTTGILVSHLHLDHMSAIGMVHPDIPVYFHRDGYKLQNLLNAIGESVGERDYSPVELYEPFRVGDIRVTAFFSDHPCAGSVGFLIEPPDGRYYYSGDIRMHGNNLDKVVTDMEKIAKEKIDVLILDTTAFSSSMLVGDSKMKLEPSLDVPEGMTSELEFRDRVLEDLRQTNKLGIFNIYHRDMELIKDLFAIAQHTNREIVFEPKTAYIVMNMLNLFPAAYIPDNKVYGQNDIPYLSEVQSKASRIVSTQEIIASPDKYFLQNSYENILELFDLPSDGARYYHLNGIPLVAGTKDYENMMRILITTGVEYALYSDLFCFDHAYPNNLLYMAKSIKAKNLIGVHSSNPEKLVSEYSKQVLPQKGETYQLNEGILTLLK
jgi:ribonuclease J